MNACCFSREKMFPRTTCVFVTGFICLHNEVSSISAMGTIYSYSHRFRQPFIKLDLLKVDSHISHMKATRRHSWTYCAQWKWIAFQISSLDDPKRILACLHEPTTCLSFFCHLPMSSEAEFGILLLIWLPVGYVWREVAVLAIVEIEGRPVPAARWLAQFPWSTYHGL